MGNKPVKYEYKPLFDPATFDMDKWIQYYENMEQSFPREDLKAQIIKCYNYIKNTKIVNNTEGFMKECAFALGMIRAIRTEDGIKDNPIELEHYDKLYKQIHDILISLR